MSAPSSEKSSHPVKTAVTVVGGSVALILGIALIAHFAVGAYSGRSLEGDPAMSEAAVAKRLKPVGDLVIVDANAPKVVRTGEQVYVAVCAGCHAAGIANAPKFGDKAAWSKQIASGFENLVKNAINGIRAMPPRGGNPDLSDVEVARAVAHMANSAGANFKAPEPAAAEAAKPAQPSAPVVTTAQPTISAPTQVEKADPNKGKSVYDANCAACHATGVAGAPKFGDKAVWAPRIAQGGDTLKTHAVKGFQGKTGVMPAKGGNASLSDADVIAAVDYMVSQAK
jgi:cytochrome c5